ncbi:MAG: cyclic pyranopterin monophosphate synthase MoaC [Thermoleophilia bacterium]|nr:cyclic pyranopterin monophosphate synthase MoaC [Thermoleophilia bacterium]
MSEFSHLDTEGKARMVDVGGKPVTGRTARAEGRVTMAPETLRLLQEQALPKGDVLSVARVAGIMAAKETSRLIPLCHPLSIEHAQIDFEIDAEASCVEIIASVSLSGKTGVEMEALVAVSMAALTIYDMCKAVDKGMEIGGIKVTEKTGGQSGAWRA